jgi:hypothetical protein
MPNPREALTKAEPFKVGVSPLREAEEAAPPQITAHTQPYMLTIRAGGRSTWKPGDQESKKESRQAASVNVNEGSPLLQAFEQGSGLRCFAPISMTSASFAGFAGSDTEIHTERIRGWRALAVNLVR